MKIEFMVKFAYFAFKNISCIHIQQLRSVLYIFIITIKKTPERLVYIASIWLKQGSRMKCHVILRNVHGFLEYIHMG
jgi:hypothetical protein